MTSIIAVYSMKGGVGKTTTAVNLAHAAAAAGNRTLLWDIDAQGAATFLLSGDSANGKARRLFSRDVEPSTLITPTHWPRLDLLAADLSLRNLDQTLADADKPKRLRKLLQGLEAGYDRIVLDCPPGLGEISDQLFRAVDLIVVPLLPTPLSLRSLELIEDHIERHHKGGPQLLPVLSMVDRRKTMHRDCLAAHAGWPVIPQASVVERMAARQAPLAEFAATSPAAHAFAELWQQVEASLAPDKPGAPQESAPTLARIPKAGRRK